MTKLNVILGSLKAWIDRQPGIGKTAKLHVSIEVSAEVDWKITLVPAIPPGINPRVKLLKFDVVLPTGPHSNAIATRTVTYQETVGAVDYTDVTVENAGENISAKVEIVV
jgi:hypothetical protein